MNADYSTEKHYQKSHCSVWLILGVATLFTQLYCSHTSAAYYFLGTGNDGYYGDAYGLWSSLSSQPGWEGASGRLQENRTGTQMVSDINWLGQAGPGDVVIWYYSGHGGAEDIDWDLDESSDFFDEHIGLQNSYNHATDDQITSALSAVSPAVPIVAILDTCRAGGFVGGTGDLNQLDNIVALLSCSESQNSYGSDPYSLFTAGLIAGLGPGLPADENADDNIRANNLTRAKNRKRRWKNEEVNGN